MLKRAFEVIVFSNLWVAFGSTCATAITLHNLQTPLHHNILLLLFVFFSTLFIYIFQRLWRMGYKRDDSNHRLRWIANHSSVLKVIAAISLICSLALALSFETNVWYFLSFCGFISAFYVIRFFKISGKRKMLRELPYSKIFIVSLVWVLITVVLPIMANSGVAVTQMDLLIMASERFFFIFAITLPFDIRDLQYDSKESLKTITSSIGVRNTKLLSITLLLSLSVLQIALLYTGDTPFSSSATALVISYIITALIIMVSNENRNELFYSGLVESTVMIQFFLVNINLLIA